jgi:hypothetical protein
MFKTSSAVTPTSISPVGILALFVPAGRCRTLPVMLTTHSLRRRRPARTVPGQIRRIKHRLRAAFAVADVNEDEAAEVAAGMDPAGQRDGLPDVCRAQFVAMMRAFHVQKSNADYNGRLATGFRPCHAPSVVYAIAGVSGSFIRPTKLTPTPISVRRDRGFVRTRPCPPKKFAFFTRTRPWRADSTVVLPGHDRGWARNPLFSPGHSRGRPIRLSFHPDTAMAGQEIRFFHPHTAVAGREILFFHPDTAVAGGKNRRFRQKRPFSS